MTRRERRAQAHARMQAHATQLAQLEQAQATQPTPSTALGEPIHNRVVRVTRAGAGARAGRKTWANVTLRDAHSPTEVLRNIAPIAGTSQGLNTVRVISASGHVSYESTRGFGRAPRTATQAAQPTQTQTYADRVAQLGAIGNVE